MSWQRVPGIVWRRSGNRVALLTEAGAEVIVLDHVGAVVWMSLSAPRTRSELVEEVATRFRAAPEEVVEPLEGLLQELEGRGVVGLAKGDPA